MTPKKISVGILGGGPSSEHNVSLNTARNVYRAIDRKKFKPYLLTLTQNKKLLLGKTRLPFPAGLKRFDVIVNALHGTFGEDGQIQKILDRVNVRYTGSGTHASELGMDKWQSRRIFRNGGLTVPSSELLTRRGAKRVKIKSPLVIKPRASGSSLGVSIVKSEKELASKLKRAWRGSNELIIEQHLPGREFTCGVLERKGKRIVLPPIEIRPTHGYEFFDYEAKYKVGATDEIVPARIPQSLTKKIQGAALRAHRLLGCAVYSRSDFIWSKDKLYILEINTLPGLTQNSLVPKAARVAGIPFPKLIEFIIEGSLRQRRNANVKN